MEKQKICLMDTQEKTNVPVSWQDVVNELKNSFDTDNTAFIVLSFGRESDFIQSTPCGENSFLVELGNGLGGEEQELLQVFVESLDEVTAYFEEFYKFGKIEDTQKFEKVRTTNKWWEGLLKLFKKS